MEEHWISLTRGGLDVILDFGFWRRSERDAARSAAARINARTKLYLVTCPDAVARERCRRRTETSQVDYLFDEVAYDALLAKFEPLGDDEERITVSTLAPVALLVLGHDCSHGPARADARGGLDLGNEVFTALQGELVEYASAERAVGRAGYWPLFALWPCSRCR